MMRKAGMHLAKSEGGRVCFQKKFEKKAGSSRHKKQWVQRHRDTSKRDALLGDRTGKGKGSFNSKSQEGWRDRQGLLG